MRSALGVLLNFFSEMTIQGITVPDNQEELLALKQALEDTLNGLNQLDSDNGSRKRKLSEECCTSQLKVVSIGGVNVDQLRRRQLSEDAVEIVYELIQVGLNRTSRD